jgi:hypothetical protein
VVEQLTRNEQVEGSTPLGGSIVIADCGLRIADWGFRIFQSPKFEIEYKEFNTFYYFYAVKNGTIAGVAQW